MDWVGKRDTTVFLTLLGLGGGKRAKTFGQLSGPSPRNPSSFGGGGGAHEHVQQRRSFERKVADSPGGVHV